MRRLSGPKATGLLGFYVPRAGGSIVYTTRATGENPDFSPEVVLFHEYGHHMLFRNYKAVYPGWYSEGFAEFVSTSKLDREQKFWIGRPAQHRAYGLYNFRLPAEKLLTADRQKFSAEDTEGLYSRGWLLTHYLTFDRARSGQFGRYLAALAEGKSPLDAAHEGFGDLKTLDRDLDKYLSQNKMMALALPVSQLEMGSVSVRALTPGEAAMMPVRVRSDRGVNSKQAAEIVIDARRLAAPFPNDPGAQVVLAEAEFDADNDDAADAAADRALAADPKSIGALLYKGRVAVRRAIAAKADAATWKQARSWFVKGNRLDTSSAEAPLLFYTSFLAQGAPPTENAREALFGAFALAPEDDGVRLLAVREFLTVGKVAEARQALAVMAFAPHAAADNWAVKVLAMIDGGKADEAKALLSGDLAEKKE